MLIYLLRVSDKYLHPSTNHGTGFLFMRAAVCKQAVACFITLAREEMGGGGGGGREREREVMQMQNTQIFCCCYVFFFLFQIQFLVSMAKTNLSHMYNDPFIIFFFI